MGTSWEMLAGDTSKFAVRVGLQRDPHDGAMATPEDSASWGSLQVWVEGKNLCAHLELDETVDSVHWYLLPILEWVADSWDALLHEERLPNSNAAATATESLDRTRFAPPRLAGSEAEFNWESAWYSWQLRHSLRAARAGGLFPNIVIRRWRDEVEISWANGGLPGVPAEVGFEFLAPLGQGRLDPLDVAQPLHTVVAAAAAELASRLPQSERMSILNTRLHAIQDEERHVERVSWLAGLSTDHHEALQKWRSIIDRSRSTAAHVQQTLFGRHEAGLVITEAPTAALLFGSASPIVVSGDIDTLLTLTSQAVDSEYDDTVLSGLARPEPIPPTGVAAAAYDLAAEVLEHVGWTGRYVDVEGILAGLNVSVLGIQLSDNSLRAVAVAGEPFQPTIGLNASYRWADLKQRRFSLAHELCHILFDQSRRRRVAVISGPWAPRDVERRANAFAAGLLMPSAAIERIVVDEQLDIDTSAGMASLSELLGTSASATLQHAYNMRFIDRATRDALADEFAWSRLA
jgi:Zn-dependent peptidase ImmA (M78 family)